MSRKSTISRSAGTSRLPRSLAALAVGSMTATGLLVSSPLTGAALAVGATSYTQTAHGTDQLDPGDPISGSQDENLVNHVTVHGDELWATFTEEAWATITDTPVDGSPEITYRGHYTAWGNYNLNQRNQTSTFTFSAKLAGSDGSTLTAHEVTQFVLRPDGTIGVAFDKATLTCGPAS
jgi:hypothetical protein